MGHARIRGSRGWVTARGHPAEETSWLKVIRNLYEGTVTRRVTDDTLPGGPIERTVTYHAPFDRCNREQDYRMAPSTVRIVWTMILILAASMRKS